MILSTGYTSKVDKGQTFEEFVLGVARAFLVHLRDAPADTPIEPPKDLIYPELLKKAEADFKEFRSADERDLAQRYTEAMLQQRELFIEDQNSEEIGRAKFLLMRDKVEAWVPPTPDHTALKDFMLEQLNITIGTDKPEPTRFHWTPFPEWVESEERRLDKRVAYCAESAEEERIRSEAIAVWIERLHESLGVKT